MRRRLFVLATRATALGTVPFVPHVRGQTAPEPRQVGLLWPSDEASIPRALGPRADEVIE
jgi:hypothetical protein